MDRTALEAQITADPRVQQLARQRQLDRNGGTMGAMPGIVTPDELRGMGYDVPGDWKFISQNMRGRQNAGLVHSDKWDYIIPAAAGAVGTFGLASALGAGAAGGAGGAGASGGTAGAAAGAAAGGGGFIRDAVKGVADNASGAGKGLLDWFKDPKNLISLAPLIGSLSGKGPFGGGSGSGGMDADFLKQAYADSQKRQQMIDARYQRVDPLHQAVTQLAMNRLPDNVRKG